MKLSLKKWCLDCVMAGHVMIIMLLYLFLWKASSLQLPIGSEEALFMLVSPVFFGLIHQYSCLLASLFFLGLIHAKLQRVHMHDGVPLASSIIYYSVSFLFWGFNPCKLQRVHMHDGVSLASSITYLIVFPSFSWV